jgi:lantibiotic biosynthesis protein
MLSQYPVAIDGFTPYKQISIDGSAHYESSRLGWCYGDPGIASSIWQAGKALKNEEWKNEAIEIMLHASLRKELKINGVMDAGICHGTAGIAHIFNRFYWETKMPVFKEAANYWIEETLKMAYHKDGLAGYKAWQGKERGWQNEYGLLEGVAGIGLVLLGFLTDDINDLSWDRCLLLS